MYFSQQLLFLVFCWCCKIFPLSELHSECCYAHLKFNASVWRWHLIYHVEIELLLSALNVWKILSGQYNYFKSQCSFKGEDFICESDHSEVCPSSCASVICSPRIFCRYLFLNFILLYLFPCISWAFLVSGIVVLTLNKLVRSYAASLPFSPRHQERTFVTHFVNL